MTAPRSTLMPTAMSATMSVVVAFAVAPAQGGGQTMHGAITDAALRIV